MVGALVRTALCRDDRTRVERKNCMARAYGEWRLPADIRGG